ncbi:hypothetical protein NHX12_010865, partial [Muraenolepis orangiensis]
RDDSNNTSSCGQEQLRETHAVRTVLKEESGERLKERRWSETRRPSHHRKEERLNV